MVVPHLLLVPEAVSLQIQDFTFPLVKHQEVPTGSFLQSFQVPPRGVLSSVSIIPTSFVSSVNFLRMPNCIILYWPQYQTLGFPMTDWPPAGLHADWFQLFELGHSASFQHTSLSVLFIPYIICLSVNMMWETVLKAVAKSFVNPYWLLSHPFFFLMSGNDFWDFWLYHPLRNWGEAVQSVDLPFCPFLR